MYLFALLKYSSAITTLPTNVRTRASIPCTTPAARGRRTRCSPGGPAASLAAACCSVSPCQQDGTLSFTTVTGALARPLFTPVNHR